MLHAAGFPFAKPPRVGGIELAEIERDLALLLQLVSALRIFGREDTDNTELSCFAYRGHKVIHRHVRVLMPFDSKWCIRVRVSMSGPRERQARWKTHIYSE